MVSSNEILVLQVKCILYGVNYWQWKISQITSNFTNHWVIINRHGNWMRKDFSQSLRQIDTIAICIGKYLLH